MTITKNGIRGIGLLLALASSAAACAAPDAEDETAPIDGEETAQSEEALRVGGGGPGKGGGDPDECMAMLMGCYGSCKTSGSGACYHYCDILYAQCRGLPPPELMAR